MDGTDCCERAHEQTYYYRCKNRTQRSCFSSPIVIPAPKYPPYSSNSIPSSTLSPPTPLTTSSGHQMKHFLSPPTPSPAGTLTARPSAPPAADPASATDPPPQLLHSHAHLHTSAVALAAVSPTHQPSPDLEHQIPQPLRRRVRWGWCARALGPRCRRCRRSWRAGGGRRSRGGGCKCPAWVRWDQCSAKRGRGGGGERR